MPIVVVDAGVIGAFSEKLAESPPDLLLPAVILSDVDGNELTFGAAGDFIMMPGAQGFGMAPTVIFADPLPDGNGAQFRGLRLTERDIFLPVLISGYGYSGLQTNRRALERLLDPERGQVTVTVAHPLGDRRHAVGVYAGGMEGSYGSDEFGIEWQTVGIIVRCFDPAFYGQPVVLEFPVPGAPKAFLSASTAFFPVELAASQVIGTVTVDNPGDKDSFPVWEIEGPGSGFVATRGSETFGITGAIALGETVIVDTRQGEQDVRDALGANLWDRLDGEDFWALHPGEQSVTTALTGATTASMIRVTFSPRYRSGL